MYFKHSKPYFPGRLRIKKSRTSSRVWTWYLINLLLIALPLNQARLFHVLPACCRTGCIWLCFLGCTFSERTPSDQSAGHSGPWGSGGNGWLSCHSCSVVIQVKFSMWVWSHTTVYILVHSLQESENALLHVSSTTQDIPSLKSGSAILQHVTVPTHPIIPTAALTCKGSIFCES